uniref:MINDY deubiquitinase domain-containing protein n=1 Tax=Setaria italica TaxID=4555 RepID=K4A279_SETIT
MRCGKEEDSNEDRDDEKTEEKDDEKTEEKDDGNIESKANISGMRVNLNIRPIDFFGRSTHVNHQINDGPCALIAVCNVLLLKEDIFFEPHETVVSMEYLLNLVVSFLKESMKMQAHCSEIQRKIWDVAQTLATGFDVDVVFTRTDGFTMTPEWLLLDCLDLNLRHGWIAAGDLLPGPEVSFESLTLVANGLGFPHAETIKKFLRGPQLTPIGLVSLQEDLVENVPCILYWNNHYNTIVKINGVLLSLAIDSNYLRTSAVWQTLHEVNCDGVYLDSNFTPIYKGLDAAPSRESLWLSLSPKIWTPRSCTYSMRSYTEEDISPEKSVPGPQIVPETREISLEEFVQISGNEFSKLKIIFIDGNFLDVVDTTKIGRNFYLRTIFVIDGVRAGIRTPYCDKFCEEVKFNDFVSYICRIIELFRKKRFGPLVIFTHLVNTLSNPPCRSS